MQTANAFPPVERQTSRFFVLYSHRQRLRSSGILKSLGQSAALVLLALADYADADGKCWPSVARLVAENPISERAVRRALAELRQRGLVRCDERAGSSTLYHITLHGTPATVAPLPPPEWHPHPCHGGTQNKADLTEQVKEHQQEANPITPPVDVVVLEEPSTEETPAKIARDIYDRLKGLGVRRAWQLARYGEPRIREVLTMLDANKTVKNQAAWVIAALQNGWIPTPKQKQGADRLREETRELLANAEACRSKLADPEEARRSKLAMVSTVIAVRKLDSARIVELLNRHGLSAEELAAYKARQDAQEGP